MPSQIVVYIPALATAGTVNLVAASIHILSRSQLGDSILHCLDRYYHSFLIVTSRKKCSGKVCIKLMWYISTSVTIVIPLFDLLSIASN